MMLTGRIWNSALVVAFTLIMTAAFASPGVESQADSQSGEKDAAESFTFRVRIQNMAPERETPTLFSPGIWVLHSEAGPIFAKGEVDREEGLEALAEDGDPTALAASLLANGLSADIFNTPVCADSPRPLQSREFYEFEVTTSRETPYLSFAAMLVQSNDLFLAPIESGIALFDGDGKPIAAQNVTGKLLLWDAGTEANEEPGEGPNQASRQSDDNVGPADDNATVRPVDDGLSYPEVAELVRVYIVPVPMIERDRGRLTIPSPDHSIGEAFQVGDVQWQVLSSENLGHELKNEKGENRATDERFIQVQFQFLNVGSDPLEFEAVKDLPLRDIQGRVYVHYRVPGIPSPHYPKEFIGDDEECFGSRWLGRWRPFVLKPNILTTCTTLFEVNVDATALALAASGLGSNATHESITVGLDLPQSPPKSIGEVVQVGDVRWQLLSAQDLGHVLEADGKREKTQKRFIAVRFQLTNKGSADLGFRGATLRDSRGREYERGRFEYVAENERCAGGILGPYGLKPNTIENCTSIYEVPSDATGLVFIADDLGQSEDGAEIVDLGLSDMKPARYFLGEEDVEVGDVCWHLVSVKELGQELISEEGETAITQGRFMQAQFQLLNLGSETLRFEDAILIDEQKRAYAHYHVNRIMMPDRHPREYVVDSEECFHYQLEPNSPKTCTLIYEVADNAQNFVFMASDLEGYEAVPVYLPEEGPRLCTVPSGMYEVGKDFAPGVYRGETPKDSFCKWARFSDLKEVPDSIIALGLHEGPFYVEVQGSDIAFRTECDLEPFECLTPTPVSNLVPAGMYVIGLDIDPGQYSGEPQEDLFCFWQRLSDFRGEDESTIAWDLPGEEYIVEVAPTDFAVEFHCPVEKVE